MSASDRVDYAVQHCAHLLRRLREELSHEYHFSEGGEWYTMDYELIEEIDDALREWSKATEEWLSE